MRTRVLVGESNLDGGRVETQLKDPAEDLRFGLCLLVSALIYLLAALTIIGAFYVALLAIVYWVSHGLMTGHLRGSAVRITEHQFPEAHAELVRLCDQLELEVPEAYVMEAGGVLNAFATRFGGRNFVVLFSDIFVRRRHIPSLDTWCRLRD